MFYQIQLYQFLIDFMLLNMAHLHPPLRSLMYLSPVFNVVPKSRFSGCTLIPFSVLYHSPVFIVVPKSCFSGCTLVLYKLLYLSPVFLDVP